MDSCCILYLLSLIISSYHQLIYSLCIIFDIICIILIFPIIRLICIMTINLFLLYLFIFAGVPDDDQLSQHEQENIPPRSCTPSTGGCINKEASQLLCDAMRCLVEDGDTKAEDWTDTNGMSLPPDRFWNDG
jgi:hypothetical protein